MYDIPTVLPINNRQHSRRTCCRKGVSNHIVTGHNLRTALLHDIQAVCIQARKTQELSDALDKHTDHWKRDTADLLLDRPSIDQHAGRNYKAEGDKTRVQSIFGDALATLLDVLLDDVVGPAAADEGADEIAASGCYVEESTLEGRCEVEAWVEDVSYWREKGIPRLLRKSVSGMLNLVNHIYGHRRSLLAGGNLYLKEMTQGESFSA